VSAKADEEQPPENRHFITGLCQGAPAMAAGAEETMEEVIASIRPHVSVVPLEKGARDRARAASHKRGTPAAVVILAA
jgi:hypothetical protein